MKKQLLATAALVALSGGGSALAADLRAPAYKAPPPVIAYGWTGFYIGGNFGLSVARNPTEAPSTDPVFGVVTNEEFHLSPFGVVGGAQIGFNWQVTQNWVWGLEADIQGSSQKDSRTCVFLCTTNNVGSTRIESFTHGSVPCGHGWVGPTVRRCSMPPAAWLMAGSPLIWISSPSPDSIQRWVVSARTGGDGP
jgi:opacity protein-like surface antigen